MQIIVLMSQSLYVEWLEYNANKSEVSMCKIQSCLPVFRIKIDNVIVPKMKKM